MIASSNLKADSSRLFSGCLEEPKLLFNSIAVQVEHSGLAARKLTNRGVSTGINHTRGLLPKLRWRYSNLIAALTCFLDMVPLALLTVLAPKAL